MTDVLNEFIEEARWAIEATEHFIKCAESGVAKDWLSGLERDIEYTAEKYGVGSNEHRRAEAFLITVRRLVNELDEHINAALLEGRSG